MRLLINSSTILWRDGHANGILLTEAKLISFFYKKSASNIFFVRYCKDLKAYTRVSHSLLLPYLDKHSLESHILKKEDMLDEVPLSSAIVFSPGDYLVSVGLEWDTEGHHQWYALKSVGVQIITMIHDLIPILYPKTCYPYVVEKFPSFLSNALWSSNAIVVNSKATGKDMQLIAHQMGLKPPEYLVQISLGDSHFGSSTNQSFTTNEDLKVGQNTILSVGTLEPRKNYLALIKAYAHALVKDQNIPDLYIVGGEGWGGIKQILIQQITKLGISKKVTIMSDISSEKLFHLYDTCKYVIYPSVYEGWGLPIIEAFHHGKACVYGAKPPMLEAAQGLGIALDTENIKELSDAILSLQSEKYLNSVENSIRVKYKSVSWNSFANSFERLIIQLGFKY